jgi:hypothetical protein
MACLRSGLSCIKMLVMSNGMDRIVRSLGLDRTLIFGTFHECWHDAGSNITRETLVVRAWWQRQQARYNSLNYNLHFLMSGFLNRLLHVAGMSSNGKFELNWSL